MIIRTVYEYRTKCSLMFSFMRISVMYGVGVHEMYTESLPSVYG